jgi:DNA polymerase-4
MDSVLDLFSSHDEISSPTHESDALRLRRALQRLRINLEDADSEVMEMLEEWQEEAKACEEKEQLAAKKKIMGIGHRVYKVLDPRAPHLKKMAEKLADFLALKGIRSMEQLLRCNIHQMRALWGGIIGERYYHWLKGDDVYVPPTRTSTLGHQHVLEPDLRTNAGAASVLMKLLSKAAARLRRERFYARRLSVHVSFMEERPQTYGRPALPSTWQSGGPTYWEKSTKLPETQDTMTFMNMFSLMWEQVPPGKPLRVGVVLSDLIREDQHQYSLFENPKREMLSRALDGVNDRFGGGTLFYGGQVRAEDAAPTRIPFTRVPRLKEFEGE